MAGVTEVLSSRGVKGMVGGWERTPIRPFGFLPWFKTKWKPNGDGLTPSSLAWTLSE